MLTAFKGAVQWLAISNAVPWSPLSICIFVIIPNRNPAPIKHKLPIPTPTPPQCDAL